MAKSHDIPDAVREALAALMQPKPMRRGSISERRMKCNKPGCPCAENPEARHGPYFSLTRTVSGRTRSRLLSAEQAEIARGQIEAGQEFRDQVEQYWEACERWADAQLEAPEAAPETGAAKKGASKKSSTRKSSQKSRRS